MYIHIIRKSENETKYIKYYLLRLLLLKIKKNLTY